MSSELQTIRQLFTPATNTVWVDNGAAFTRAKEFLTVVMPEVAARLQLHEGAEPLLRKYGIEPDRTQ
jgi:ribonuclease E